jgi:hypothetical protein
VGHARRSELDALAEELAKQLQEVQAGQDHPTLGCVPPEAGCLDQLGISRSKSILTNPRHLTSFKVLDRVELRVRRG